MNRALSLAALTSLLWTATADARAPRAPRTPRAEPTRPAYVPSPMAIGRVRVEVRGAKVLVTTDVTIPQASQALSDMDVHVAYGAPGPPLAFEAQIVANPQGFLVAPVEDGGARLSHEWSPRAPSWSVLALGRPQMGGQLVHVRAAALTSAQRETGRATLRIRQVYALPALLADQSRELVVRLGSMDGQPVAVGLIEFASDAPMPRVEARYCGLEGERAPLFVAGAAQGSGGAAASLTGRGANDDLCMRFGATGGPERLSAPETTQTR